MADRQLAGGAPVIDGSGLAVFGIGLRTKLTGRARRLRRPLLVLASFILHDSLDVNQGISVISGERK